jgi:hypothetical protein
MVLAAQDSTQDANAHRDNIKNYSLGFIFLGTPHQGSKLTIAGKICALFSHWGGSSTTLLEVIDRQSNVGKKLHSQFLNSYDRDATDIVNFYESEPEVVAGFPIMTVSQSLTVTVKGLLSLTVASSRLLTSSQPVFRAKRIFHCQESIATLITSSPAKTKATLKLWAK